MSAGQLDNEEIIQQLRNHRAELSQLKVERIGLFGSYAKDAQSSESDIDFLVNFEKVSFNNYMELKFFLEELFGKDVDLVIEDDLKPMLEYVKDETEYIASA